MGTSWRLLIGFSFGFSCSTFTNGRIGGDGILFVAAGVLFDVCLFAVVVVVVCAVVSFDSIDSGTRASAFEAVALLSELFNMSMTSRKTIKT